LLCAAADICASILTVHPRLGALFADLEQDRNVLRAAVDAVPATRREQRLDPDRWSVAEVLEHLWIAETGVADLVTTKIAEARAGGLLAAETDSSPLPASKRLALVRERGQRVTAPHRLLPRAALTITGALAALARSRDALRTAALTGDGMALGTITYPHPFAGPFNLYQWIAFVGAHEVRHARQIREIAGV
jgi:hypothetical protein